MNHPDRAPATLAAEATACRRLWADVFAAALADADRGDALAVRWLTSPAARTVADLAGLDGDAVADALARRPARHPPDARPGRAGKCRKLCDNSEPADRFTADTAAPRRRPQHE